VDHPQPRADIEKLGRHLGWHGGLTLDYLHRNGTPQYIEANARTVEPGNPAASGVILPALTIAISCGDSLPATLVVGRSGVRKHSLLALMLGTAETSGSRGAALRALMAGLGHQGSLRGSREYSRPCPQTRCRWSQLAATPVTQPNRRYTGDLVGTGRLALAPVAACAEEAVPQGCGAGLRVSRFPSGGH
jgi:hypothetical protein